jgi:DNA polymerase III gamma/tau subunit
VDKLREIVQSKGIKIYRKALCSIAHLTNGEIRNVESILDRMGTFCNDEITIEAINSAYGLANVKTIDDIISSIYYGNYKKLIKFSYENFTQNCKMYKV